MLTERHKATAFRCIRGAIGRKLVNHCFGIECGFILGLCVAAARTGSANSRRDVVSSKQAMYSVLAMAITSMLHTYIKCVVLPMM